MNLKKLVLPFLDIYTILYRIYNVITETKSEIVLEIRKDRRHQSGPAAEREVWPLATAGPATAQGGGGYARATILQKKACALGNQTTR
jgi:hypothetical protein